ncbi:hypothetical protein KKE34_00835 [Patescibacteria group bacterium]|nr:hypothetical protein [Patescibacteria group bacterium]MBU1885135.1 hypothetical protein [Patescibacteria group bacterium]
MKTVISTTSAAIINQDLLWENPYIQYIISPAIVFSLILFFAYKILDLGSTREKFKRALKDVDGLKTSVDKLLNHMAIVKTQLVDKTGLDSNLFGSSSPLSLKKKGKELLKESGFEKIYRDNKSWFVEELKKNEIGSLVDLDEASLVLIEKCHAENKFINYKEIAFENGVMLEVLLRVISIWLRDKTAKKILDIA